MSTLGVYHDRKDSGPMSKGLAEMVMHSMPGRRLFLEKRVHHSHDETLLVALPAQGR